MAVIIWNKLFEFDVPEMDKQHRTLVEIMNRLVDSMESADGKIKILALMEVASQYVVNHFTDEEKLMTDIGYPELEKQQKLHKEIIEKMLIFKKGIESGEIISVKGTIEELRELFKTHIFVEDRKYGYFYHNSEMLPDDS